MAGLHTTYRVLDRDYPRELRELPAPPDPLCIRGELLVGPSVAVVGTREPSAAAALYTHDLAFRLASRGIAVWSGGATGIDAAAHRGALDAKGVSVAVIGTGLDHCYPPEHRPLYEEIVLAGGAIVSPFDRAQEARLWTFPHRNGVLAALTQVTIVVQAPLKSGARSTAAFARRLGRPVFVVPASPWDPLGEGNAAELALGARMLVHERELFDCLGVHVGGGPAERKQHSRAPPRAFRATTASEDFKPEQLSPECRAIFEMLSSTPVHLDDLCDKSDLPTALIHAALLTLSLQAVLVEGPAGWFRRVTF
jgi:DNA processing protein